MTASIRRCHPGVSSRAVARRVGRRRLHSGPARFPIGAEIDSAARVLKGSKNGHVLRLVAGHTHFNGRKATPTPKATAKPRGREDAGRRPGAWLRALAMSGPRRTPSEDAAGRCRACLTAFFVRFAPLPSSRPKPSGTRFAQPNLLCWRTSGSNKPKQTGPSALGSAH